MKLALAFAILLASCGPVETAEKTWLIWPHGADGGGKWVERLSSGFNATPEWHTSGAVPLALWDNLPETPIAVTLVRIRVTATGTVSFTAYRHVDELGDFNLGSVSSSIDGSEKWITLPVWKYNNFTHSTLFGVKIVPSGAGPTTLHAVEISGK
uniref:Uncharacterized protein n=1 Tax=viral metagenome TaxID=1070528 RepID=A0A6H1Z850_9ZZZZ